MVSCSTSCVISVRRRRQTFAAPIFSAGAEGSMTSSSSKRCPKHLHLLSLAKYKWSYASSSHGAQIQHLMLEDAGRCWIWAMKIKHRTFRRIYQLPMIYANIHTTYRRRQRIHAIHWSNRTIAYPCCAGYVQQRDWPHISCHFRSCFVDRPPDGPGRNTTGQHNLY